MDEILTVNEIAHYLKVDTRTIYRLVKQGKIPGRKVGGTWRFKKDILDGWLAGSRGGVPWIVPKKTKTRERLTSPRNRLDMSHTPEKKGAT